jgi:hypothetical protein
VSIWRRWIEGNRYIYVNEQNKHGYSTLVPGTRTVRIKTILFS